MPSVDPLISLINLRGPVGEHPGQADGLEAHLELGCCQSWASILRLPPQAGPSKGWEGYGKDSRHVAEAPCFPI